MRAIAGDVKSKRYHPKKTGWIWDLYRTRGVTEAESQDLETKFLGPLDGNAARALDKLVAKEPLSTEERRQWTRFLLSLLFRQREHVATIKSHMADICREALIASEDEWERLRKSEETRSLVEAMAGDRELALSETHAEKIMRENYRAAPRRARHHGDALVLHRSARLADSAADIGPADCLRVAVGPYQLHRVADRAA
jgi:hypothetical protein